VSESASERARHLAARTLRGRTSSSAHLPRSRGARSRALGGGGGEGGGATTASVIGTAGG
jgi:hypothetical protein